MCDQANAQLKNCDPLPQLLTEKAPHHCVLIS